MLPRIDFLKKIVRDYRQFLLDHRGGNRSTKRAIDMMESFGIDVQITPHQGMKDIEWNGRAIYLGDKEPWGVLHELAHFQCSSPLRRLIPEYGLGGFNNPLPRILPKKEADKEECRVSILQTLWEAQLGYDPTMGASEVFLFSTVTEGFEFVSGDSEDIEKSLNWLIRNELITKDFKPTNNIRKSPDKKLLSFKVVKS